MIEKKIVYIEQPYDINLSSFEEWVEIKKASPFKILAD